ncbi:MAG: hypothetical protein MJB14_19030, partial [Spirochaetes bacterium]|nr:hypothetical protein [Spirochaetota bacterium]
TAILNYLYITLDHLFAHINTECQYVNQKEYQPLKKEFTKQSLVYINFVKKDTFFLLKSSMLHLQFAIHKLRKEMLAGKKIEQETKKIFFVKLSQLICIFFEKIEKFEVFYNENHPLFDQSYQQTLNTYSQYLFQLLKEETKNSLEILFVIFQFQSLCPELNNLNNKLYQRIIYILKKFFNRKIYILSSVMYLKSLKKEDFFHTEILKVKYHIEHNPIISLINLFNNELMAIPDIPPEKKIYYRANSELIMIHEKIFDINKLMFNYIYQFRVKQKNQTEQIKLGYLEKIEIEMRNIFQIAANPYLITDLGQLYIFFIDSYINKNKLDYREDLISQASAVKMEIMDINPTSLSLALLYSKLGKFQLIIDYDNPIQLGLNKSELSQTEKNRMSNFIEYSKKILPTEEPGINWPEIVRAIENIREPVYTREKTTPLDARIIKVLSAILNKISRQNVAIAKVFSLLYEEAFLPSQNTWDLDPILIFYFNTYYSRQQSSIFYDESTGEKVEVKFGHLNNSLIYEKINQFIKDLMENSHGTNLSVEAQMEEMAKINAEPLFVNNQRKHISQLEIEGNIDTEKTIYFEKAHIEKADITYLVEILQKYLTCLGRSSYFNIYKQVLIQLINNANKGNYKREFFHYKKMDLDSYYWLGVKRFQEEYKVLLPELKPLAKKLKLSVKVEFYIFQNVLTITVSNNYRYLSYELDLVDQCISKVRSSKDLKDIYNAPIETQEGQGVGLSLASLFN